MKTARLVKIIVSSVMTFILTLLLVILLFNGMECTLGGKRTFTSLSGQKYTEIVEEERFSKNIKEINIVCAATDTVISSDNGERIRVYEEAEDNGSNRLYPCYRIENDVLYIKYMGNTDTYDVVSNPNKVLRIAIPSEMKLLRITVNAGPSALTVEDLTCSSLEVDSVSGLVSVKRVNCTNAKFTSNSAGISISEFSASRLLEIETFSGDIAVGLSKCSNNTSIVSAHGAISLKFPENVSGFVLKVVKGNGEFSIDPKYGENQNSDGHYLYGDKISEVNIKNKEGKIFIL